MFRMWRWQPFPLKRGLCNVETKHRTATEFTAAPEKMKRVELKGYMLFLDDAYREDAPGPDGLPTGHFRLAGRDRELVIMVEEPGNVSGLGRREKDNLRLAAERMARGQATDSEMIVLRSEQYHKKMNLVGDLAAFGCWAVHLRTPQRDVGVIAIRRKFIPPIGDTYQGAQPGGGGVRLRSAHGLAGTLPSGGGGGGGHSRRPLLALSLTRARARVADVFVVLHDDVDIEDATMFMSGLERQADTLSPLVRVPFYDDTITRVKADALLYDEDSFSWFHAEVRRPDPHTLHPNF
jgi:hypothetical protein